MGKLRNRRTEMELNETLRLQTLRCILEARSTEYMAEKFGVTEKAIKFRLTNLYKYYKVKSKYELMALFVELPEEVIDADVQVDVSLEQAEENLQNAIDVVAKKQASEVKVSNETTNTLPAGAKNIWS